MVRERSTVQSCAAAPQNQGLSQNAPRPAGQNPAKTRARLTLTGTLIFLLASTFPAQAQLPGQVYSKAFSGFPVPCDGNEYSTSPTAAANTQIPAQVDTAQYITPWESQDIYITEVDLCLLVQGNLQAGYWYAMVGESGPDGDPISGYLASPDVCGKFPHRAGEYQIFPAAGGFHIDAHVWCTGAANAAARFIIRYTKVQPQ